MRTSRQKSIEVMALTPSCWLTPEIAIAACRAGATGVLDLGIGQTRAAVETALARLKSSVAPSASWGVRWDAGINGGISAGINAATDASGGCIALSALLGDAQPVPLLVLGGLDADAAARIVHSTRELAAVVMLEVQNLQGAKVAQDAGFDGVIVKGHEAGGRVSAHASFMLLQEFSGQLEMPWWIQGGIGRHTVAAAALAGAAGVVMGEPLWLADEGPFHTPAQRMQWSKLDGSETVLIGSGETLYRFFARSGRAQLRELEVSVAKGESWQASLASRMLGDDQLIALGQDIAFAPVFAERYGTVGRMITALREHATSAIEQAAAQVPLAPDSALAQRHGTRYPIAQGPMTRVSDVGAFAAAVAEGGALPFLALAVLRGKQVRAVLERTAEHIGARPWGVGILGFLPLEMRQAQLEVVREFKPPFAIIAGGRPSQARELDEAGTVTYLHVPSPGLLRGFLADGARRFVFEGSECGGHTGPRTSFILWESAVEILLNADIKYPESIQVLFAGGVHDALSAAMVSAVAAPLVARGMKIGVLMGTAYLFTHEIVAQGAIVEEFQRQAVACEKTALLQSGVGVYTRCAQTPFCDEFDKVRRDLILASSSDEDTLMKLEMMNIGRLRIAAKGIAHRSEAELARGEDGYVEVNETTQRNEGIYMLGEVARLRTSTCSVAELHENVSAGSEALLRKRARPVSLPGRTRREDIAIVGMACLFPGAQSMREYWQNILRGVDAIREVSDDRWRVADLFDPKRGTPDKIYSKWGGFLDDIAFDPQRYGIAPASVASIEPVQLLALEVSRLALEDAGFERRGFPRERTATIFAVGGMNDLGTIFNFRALLPHYLRNVPGLSDEAREQLLKEIYEDVLPKWTEDTFPGILGNVIAGRVANRLDLGGANFTVDAACASSLAALDAGIRQLRSHDADVALVGGVDGTNGPLGFMCFAQTYALSPRGRSRPFDDSADGIAISEGVGAVVLKRVADAERDGDRIYAVIKGMGSSSDGRNRSLTAPHPPAQVQALKRAYAEAGVDPAAVTLIEAHGTGTALGDKSEIAALNLAFGEAAMGTQECAVGSVKSMIGHTKVAAGMAGLIKAALALRHRVLPPTIGVEKPASGIDFATSPFYVNTQTRPWLRRQPAQTRYCGVSAFGFGGTNFHTVLAEYTGSFRASDALDLNPRDVEIFAFAGPTRAVIEQAVSQMMLALERSQSLDLAQLAWSLYREQAAVKRVNGSHACRLVVLAASVAELRQKLRRALELLPDHADISAPPSLFYSERKEAPGGVCFLFPGQGSQRVNMLRDLVTAMPELQHWFDEAPALAEANETPSRRIASHIFPVPVFSDAERDAQQEALNDTAIAQPALGMTGMAAFDVLTRFGLHPDHVAGHSYGEYVALCAAGALPFEALIRLSKLRGKLSANAPTGAMAALEADGARVAQMIAEHALAVSIANVNAPDQTIVSGTVDAIDVAISTFSDAGMRVKKLPVSAAFHCDIMAGPRDALAAALADIEFNAPRVPVYSNTTGEPYPPTGEAVRALLARHIAEPVRFADEIEALYQAGVRVFIECGPGLVLGGLVDRILGERKHATLGLDAPGRPGGLQLAQLLAQAQTLGLLVRLDAWFAHRGLKDLSVDDVFADAVKRDAPGPLIWRVNAARAKPWHAPQPRVATRRPAMSINVSAPAPVQAPSAEPPAGAAASMAAPLAPPPLATPAAADPAPAIVPSVPAAMPALPVSTSTLSDRRTTMKMENLPGEVTAGMARTAPPVTERCSETEFAQIQFGVSRLLELQFEQQRSLRHFLDFQAQLVATPRQRVAIADSLPPASPYAVPMVATPMVAAPANAPLTASVAVAVATPQPAAVSTTLDAAPPTPVLPQQITAVVMAATSPALTPAPTPAPQRVAPAASSALIEAPDVIAVLPGVAGAANPASTEAFRAHLLQAVSERTGYPLDMLDPDAHMEADLGIDSIKRVEIFSNLTTKFNLLGDRDEEAVIEALSGLKSLNEIVAWYASMTGTAAVTTHAPEESASVIAGGHAPKKASAPPTSFNEAVEPDGELAHVDPVQCYAVQAVAAGLDGDGEFGNPFAHADVLIVGAGPLADAFATALGGYGASVHRLAPGAHTRVIDDKHYEVDLSSLESVKPLRDLVINECTAPPVALINVMGATADPSYEDRHDARALFLLLKAFEPDLKARANDGAWIVNVTAFDGQFGLSRSRAFEAGRAGVLGVAKSAAREWSDVKVKCVDVDPALDVATQASQVVDEIRSGRPGVEVGYTQQGRWLLDLRHNGVARQDLSRLTLEADAVVLVTGGACGITADVTRALAERYRPKLILVGRSPLPATEDATTANIDDPRALKQALIRALRASNDKVTPAEIDRVYTRILRNREIRANLAAMRAAGATIEYHSLDVRDEKSFEQLIDHLYARYGRIDGVLHGAGVISDKLIADKPLEAFDTVFDTKVTPALVLERRLRPEHLKFIVFFSSVTGRFGNVGQSDYSAANEVLNKLADRLCHLWPQVHALSINWGPWDAGMVSDTLRRLYASRSIRPIPVEQGRRHFMAALERGASGTPELVISSSIQQIASLRLGQERHDHRQTHQGSTLK
ncbi:MULTISPECIES: SDR family NAD(P)-dependent oxidoreductase [unclassified Paraburkholderia]|uniref:SDR family NAD(P)-dependent oxidoreductase n=1 Tax=unclassified Paraburkholderia TaxID=2615204 RepID=UPI002AB1E2DC|nr:MULTISPECIES: SDR family NAD(P)-dependent oxidoreductase [unclassified Paraburkholderia]